MLELSGCDWLLGQAPAGAEPGDATWSELDRVAQWLPAQVPGNVRADLMAAGRLPDLYWNPAAGTGLWVDDHCWWLAREFDLDVTGDDRVHLILNGVDYISDLFLNGHHLGRHEGMFSPQIHDISRLVQDRNRLAVRIVGNRWLPTSRSSAWEKVLNLMEARTGGLPGTYPHRRDTLKCQMSFGWDFAPPLRPMGIWDSVCAVISRDVFIEDVTVQAYLAEPEATLAVTLQLHAATGRQAVIRVTLEGETFTAPPVSTEIPIQLQPGAKQAVIQLAVPAPRLWWPWDHGHPHLYRLAATVHDGAAPLDEQARVIGLRTVELEDWNLYINGRRIYARGANWVPADILPGRVGPVDYQALLELARGANMNMLRVWGGGLREKRAFYELCDRMGILVWQEFPVACAFLTRYPRSAEFGRLLAAEARAIVRALRNHPSLVLWCGGNEFSAERNKALVTTLQQVLATEDAERPFVPASPGTGDSHNWRVWHEYEPPAAYRQDTATFASEFGLQAPPAAETLRKFIPAEEPGGPGHSWAYRGANIAKLRRYAEPFLDKTRPDLEALIQASQRAQAHGLQVAIEHYRRRKALGAGGLLVWQLNEPWPAISWALVTYDRQPKPAYDVVRRLLAPQLISLQYPLRPYEAGDRFSAAVWVVSDSHFPLQRCRVQVTLWDRAGQPACQLGREIDVDADSAAIVDHLRCTLPPGGGWRVTCQLLRDEHTLAANEYDLTVHDGIRPAPLQRLRNRFVEHALRHASVLDLLSGTGQQGFDPA